MSNDKLAPGTYIDSHWGHYQSQRIIELAQVLEWPDRDSEETGRLLEKYPDLDQESNEPEIWQEIVDDAEQYINDNHVPDGYWFGHHPDIGDIGVWEFDDE